MLRCPTCNFIIALFLWKRLKVDLERERIAMILFNCIYLFSS